MKVKFNELQSEFDICSIFEIWELIPNSQRDKKICSLRDVLSKIDHSSDAILEIVLNKKVLDKISVSLKDLHHILEIDDGYYLLEDIDIEVEITPRRLKNLVRIKGYSKKGFVEEFIYLLDYPILKELYKYLFQVEFNGEVMPLRRAVSDKLSLLTWKRIFKCVCEVVEKRLESY